MISYAITTPISLDIGSLCRLKYCGRDIISMAANEQGLSLLQSIDNDNIRVAQVDL